MHYLSAVNPTNHYIILANELSTSHVTKLLMHPPRHKGFNLFLLWVIYEEAADILSPAANSCSIHFPSIATTDIIDTAEIDIFLKQYVILSFYVEHKGSLKELYL